MSPVQTSSRLPSFNPTTSRGLAGGLAIIASLLAASCSGSSRGEASEQQGAAVVREAPAEATDPVTHLSVLAGAAMEGRGSGTPAFDRAADYVANECRTAGVLGAFPETPDQPYFQPFTLGAFAAATRSGDPHEALKGEVTFGSELFEDGLFLTGKASQETLAEMNAKFCAAWTQMGATCPLEGTPFADARPLMPAGLPTKNVVGLLPGSGPHKDEIILLSAHLDHLGKTARGTYFGADDNASGSSALLAIMHKLARRTEPLDRTIAFLWTSGEEKGLLGSAYFVDNAPASIPIAKVKQVVNMDMVGAWDDARFSIGTDGSAASDATAQIATEANQAMTPPFQYVNKDIQQYARRQDGYSFTRRQVPSLFIFEGLSRATGGGSLMPRYHQVTDTVEALLADNGGSKLRRMADLITLIAVRLANPPS